jgi:transposase-like protein
MTKTGHRKFYSGEIKARVAVEAIRGMKTANEIASDYQIHPMQISKWKKQAMEELPGVFSRKRDDAAKTETELKARLYQEIGQLKVELDWLKKKSGLWGY